MSAKPVQILESNGAHAPGKAELRERILELVGEYYTAAFPPREFVPRPEDPSRDPLPAGHPRSWGVITSGTLLEDTPYPLPVFPH